MISNININNYALIDQTVINLERGFSVITGETGAGKSILLGAIGLTLGERADSSVIMDKSRKCVIEVTYQVAGYHLEKWFEEHDLDYGNAVIVRREILADGRSRSFINDTPVNNKLLKELGGFLIDIHSQHQSLLIGRPEYQLEILDAFSENIALLSVYQEKYKKWQQLKSELSALYQQADAARREEDYLQFQFNQLEAANLRAGEQRELEEEQAMLSHAEGIKAAFSELAYQISGADVPVLALLKSVKNKLAALSGIVKEADEYESRLQTVIIELEDLADGAERYAESVEYVPARVEFVQERLNAVYELLYKHKVENEEALIDLKEALAKQLRGIQSFEERIVESERQIAVMEEELKLVADKIHEIRLANRENLMQEMQFLLMDLGIKHAVFFVEIKELDHFVATGKDEVKFLFSANKNQHPGELVKVASGGEISRLMLSLKYILSRNKQLPVIIFDEIDTGVSGDIAHKMAVMMKEMSSRMQVISISHLPQIAAAGNIHLKVYKEDEQHGTVSRIRQLGEEERIKEIAGMISGSEITDIALENARLLLQHV